MTTLQRAEATPNAEVHIAVRLEEMTLSLTISAKGNIGVASTSAEAGIKLVFKRAR